MHTINFTYLIKVHVSPNQAQPNKYFRNVNHCLFETKERHLPYKGSNTVINYLIKHLNYHNMGVNTLQSFGGRPSVFVSAKYTRDTKPDDAMYVWLENVNSGSFEVCIREFLPFDGKHQDTIVVRTSFSIDLFCFKLSMLGHVMIS